MQGEFTFVMDNRDYQTLQSILTNMDKIDGNKAVKQGLDKGISSILREGKSNLSARNKKKTGNLSRAMTKAVKKGYAQAGFRRSHTSKQGSKIKGGNHAHLIDRGTKERWTKKQLWKGTRYRGSIAKGNPQHGTMFWTDAVESKGPEAQRNLFNAIYDAMNNITKRK